MARSQANTADHHLARAFSKVDINRPLAAEDDPSRHDFHLLSLEYPACNLLPPGCLPHLAPPQYVALMNAPPVDKRAIGVDETTFFAVLPVKARSTTPVSPPYNHMALLAAVDQLSSGSGESRLEVVCFYDVERGGIVYRLKLTTSYRGEADVDVVAFELGSGQWRLLLGSTEFYGWIGILQGLVARSTYWAVYHVREKLAEAYGVQVAAEEERAWPIGWGSVRHSASADTSEAALSAAMGKARTYEATNQDWLALDSTDLEGDVSVEVHAMTLFRALHAVLQSLSPPDPISPSCLGYANSRYTKLVLEDLGSLLYGIDFHYTITAKQLLAYLFRLPTGTRVANDSKLTVFEIMTLPGWLAFLRTWFTRVVKFVVHRCCETPSTEHAGLHQHGGEVWHNPEVWEGEAAALQAYCYDEEEKDGGDEGVPEAVRLHKYMIEEASLIDQR